VGEEERGIVALFYSFNVCAPAVKHCALLCIFLALIKMLEEGGTRDCLLLYCELLVLPDVKPMRTTPTTPGVIGKYC
jgi:hypothetical protein